MATRNPVTGATITQGFGYTGLSSNGPFLWNYNGRYYPVGFHPGIDLAAATGTKVRNIQHGIVYAASWNGCNERGCWLQGGGYAVVVRHNSHPFYSCHAHMNRLYVVPGQPVYKGQPLGALDTMGYASGPHDHHMVWVRDLWYNLNGAYPMDPRRYWSGGDLANKGYAQPASMRVQAHTWFRKGPGPDYDTGRFRYDHSVVVPYFKTVTGKDGNRWRLTWRRSAWRWARASHTDIVRRVAEPPPAELEGESMIALGGESLETWSPGPDLSDRGIPPLDVEPSHDWVPRRGKPAWWDEFATTHSILNDADDDDDRSRGDS